LAVTESHVATLNVHEVGGRGGGSVHVHQLHELVPGRRLVAQRIIPAACESGGGREPQS
jgi:hypothetical protein